MSQVGFGSRKVNRHVEFPRLGVLVFNRRLRVKLTTNQSTNISLLMVFFSGGVWFGFVSGGVWFGFVSGGVWFGFVSGGVWFGFVSGGVWFEEGEPPRGVPDGAGPGPVLQRPLSLSAARPAQSAVRAVWGGGAQRPSAGRSLHCLCQGAARVRICQPLPAQSAA